MIYQATKRQKGVEGHTIDIGVEARTEVYGKPTPRKGSYINREESLQSPTDIHIQGNITFVGP